MLGPAPRIPKVVTVRVKCAEGLKIIPKSEHKQKKLTQKWKVYFIGGKKKMSTNSVLDTYGNPQWDSEVTFKLASKSDPISLLVTDSEDHHVGQVVIPLVALRPRPQNPAERPTDPSRLQRADLEATKKVASPHGVLYFWIWVEEYRSDEPDTKSTKGSLLSLTSLKHSKRASSVADSLNYSGSVISVNSSQGDGKEKKHRLFKKRSGKDLLSAAASLSTRRLSGAPNHDPSLSRSMGSVFDPTNRSTLRRVSQDYLAEDHDGSILGAGSDMTGSEFYGTGGMQRTGQLNAVNADPTSLNLASSQNALPIPSNRSAIRSPEPARRISPVREDPREQEKILSMQAGQEQMGQPTATGPQPALLRLTPNSCPTTGGVEVTVYCTGLTDDMMRYASVLVDGYTVPRQDWFLQDTGRSDRAELRIHMPERPTGRCWIELETMQHGRIRCPEEFQYTAAPVPTAASTTGNTSIMSNPSADNLDAGRPSPLTRTGSQRSSLLIRDRRSTRRGRPPTSSEVPANETKQEPESSRSSISNDVQNPPQSPANPSVTCPSPTPAQNPFVRRGSNRDSLTVVDRRSTRRLNQANKPNLPNKDPTVLVLSNEDKASSKPMDEFTVHYAPASSPFDPTESSTSFSRTGSQRSSLRVSDRRSTRRTRNQIPQLLFTNDNPLKPEDFLPEDEARLNPTEELSIATTCQNINVAIPENKQPSSKLLTPVIEDAEIILTPPSVPLESDGKRDSAHAENPSISVLFPANQSRRAIVDPNNALNSSPPKTSPVQDKAWSHERESTIVSALLAQDESAIPNHNLSRLSDNARFSESVTAKPLFDKTSESVLSTPYQANDVGSPNRTPTAGRQEPFQWTPQAKTPVPDLDSVQQPLINSNCPTFPADSELEPAHNSQHDPFSDVPQSAKTESLFSLDLRDPSLQPIASKSPSLVRGSYSRSSDRYSMSYSPDEEDEVDDLPFDSIVAANSQHLEAYTTFNPRVGPTIPEDSQLPDSLESDRPSATHDSGIDSMKEQSNPFVRTGSQRSSLRVTDRRSMRRARPPTLLPDAQKPPEPIQVQPPPPESLQSSDESPTAERYEVSGGEAGSESNFSGEHSQMDAFHGFSARRRNSFRSEASGQSRSIVEEHSKLETETLRSMLSEANQLIDSMKKQTLDLEKQLSEKSADVDRLSLELCKLRLRLLEGGATQFLEKCY